MIRLVRGKQNRVVVDVKSSIDISGFSAYLAIGSALKQISALTKGKTTIELSAAETDAIENGEPYGTFAICNAEGKIYMLMLPQFQVVDEDGRLPIAGYQTLPVTIVSTTVGLSSTGGDTPSGDYVRKSDFDGIEDANPSINSCQSTINEMLEGIRK